MIEKNAFIKQIKDLLKSEFKSSKDIEKGILIETNRSLVKDIAQFLSKYDKCILNGIFIKNNIDTFELIYSYSLDFLEEGFNLYFQIGISRTINAIESISDLFPSAKGFENRIYNLYNLTFVQLAEKEERSIFCSPMRIDPPNSENNPLSYGIFNKIHFDKRYFEMEIKEGKISHVILQDGWLHKDIIETINKKDKSINDILKTYQDIDDISVVHNSLGFILGIEELLKIRVQNKVTFIRTLLAELERLRNHMIWFTNLLYLLDFNKGYMKLLNYVRNLEIIINRICGNPKLKNSIMLGNCVDIEENIAAEFNLKLIDLVEACFKTLYSFIYQNFTKEKLYNSGKIGQNFAIKYGLSGPSLRGSGIPYDVRYTSPYLIYTKGELSQLWEVISFEGSDNYSRAQVRLWEIKQSLKICSYILRNLSFYDAPVKPFDMAEEKLKFPKNAMSIIKLEAPQGTHITYIKTAKETQNKLSIYLVPPSIANFNALNADLLVNQFIGEIPLTIHSMDLNFPSIDL